MHYGTSAAHGSVQAAASACQLDPLASICSAPCILGLQQPSCSRRCACCQRCFCSGASFAQAGAQCDASELWPACGCGRPAGGVWDVARGAAGARQPAARPDGARAGRGRRRRHRRRPGAPSALTRQAKSMRTRKSPPCVMVPLCAAGCAGCSAGVLQTCKLVPLCALEHKGTRHPLKKKLLV